MRDKRAGIVTAFHHRLIIELAAHGLIARTQSGPPSGFAAVCAPKPRFDLLLV